MVRHAKRRRPESAAAPADAPAAAQVIVQFRNAADETLGDQLELALDTPFEDLQAILRSYLPEEERLDEHSLVLSDSGVELIRSLRQAFEDAAARDIHISTEETLAISYYASAPFKVRPIARLTGSLQGHEGTILCVAFSADGTQMASGSGDCNVRLWDLQTATPICVLKGHSRPVVSLAFSADGKWLASGSEDKTVRVWKASECLTTRQPPPVVLNLHRDTITALDFMPMHLHAHWLSGAPLLLSGARDGTLKIWDVVRGAPVTHLNGHTAMVTSAKWSGMTEGTFAEPAMGPFVYSASRDMTVRVWSSSTGLPLRVVKCHGHWVNALSLNTEGIMRAGAFDPQKPTASCNGPDALAQAEKAWAAKFKNHGEERVVTCSDDNSLSLWQLLRSEKRLTHMLGHQKAVCTASFSPNGRYIASGGFDSAIRLWDGRTGKFLHTYRGHVGPVYQVSWAPDSRLFVSCSKDSTLKVWDTAEGGRILKSDLPGAADEIYAVAWSPNCSSVVSGGKDKILRIWHH